MLYVCLHLQTEVDADTQMPVEELTRNAKSWCESLDSNAMTVSDVLQNKDDVLLKAIQDGIDRANAKSVSRAQKVQKWSILPRDFSIPGGELG